MRDRRALPWMLGLGLVAVVAVALALAVTWWGADLQGQAYTFFTNSAGTGGVSQAEYDYWNVISVNAYALQTLAGPLVIGALTALLTLLAVLARRWDLTYRADQDEATAAS